MIDWLVGYALRKRLVVAMICVFVAIYGYYSWTQLAIEAYPDIAEVTVARHHPGDWLGGRRGRAAGHDSARTGAQRDTGSADHALREHLRTVVDHARVPRRSRRAIGLVSASWSGSSTVALPPGLTPELGPLSTRHWRDLQVHPRVRQQGSARALRDPDVDRHSRAQAGSGSGRCRELRRHHDAISA